MDNLTPEESIKKAEEMGGKPLMFNGKPIYADSYWNPTKNPEAISIVKQGDGNYKLWGQRNGKMIELRSGKPEDALIEFLTHD